MFSGHWAQGEGVEMSLELGPAGPISFEHSE